ncbi:MAG: hypothetical protein KIS78_21165 [Labilithrix sp.]|nr:hypothetical protein [Labilithrix sp.]
MARDRDRSGSTSSAARASVLAALALAGCLDGDPNPTNEPGQGSSGASGSSSSGGAGSSGASGQPAPAPTVEPSGACSQSSAQAVNLPFRNAFTDRSVRLFWVDYGCNEVGYDVLAPGQARVQQTFVSHPWRVRDAATNALYKEYVPTTTAPPEVVVP